MAALSSATLRRRVPRAGRLEGIIQIGTGYALPSGGPPIATFEDMTVVQATMLGYPEWLALGKSTLKRRLRLQRDVYAMARACCGATAWVTDSLASDYGLAREKLVAVGLGANHTVEVTERDWRTPRYLFVGREWGRKNGDGVVAAFRNVLAAIPEARLDLVGEHPPVAVDGVTGHGPIEPGSASGRRRMEHLLASATVFVLPSWREPGGIAYVEAAAAGLPSIGTSVGGARHLIGDGGIVVEPGDHEALVNAMLCLADPEVARKCGCRAREVARAFTWELVADRIVAALGLGGRASATRADTDS